MKIGEAFPSKFLKAEDLNGKRVAVKIKYVEMEKIGDDDKKPVVYFSGKEKGLVLNKTNAGTIAEITGTEEMDDWSGQGIVLFPDKTSFQGKRVDCIRIAEASPGVATAAAAVSDSDDSNFADAE